MLWSGDTKRFRPRRLGYAFYHKGIAADVVAPDARRTANGDECVDGFPRDAFACLAAACLFRVPVAAEADGDGLAHVNGTAARVRLSGR